MKEFDRARADFQRVTQLYPANKAAKSQIMLCQKHIKEQHEKDKLLYANMFQKFADRDAKVSAVAGSWWFNIDQPNFLSCWTNASLFLTEGGRAGEENERHGDGNRWKHTPRTNRSIIARSCACLYDLLSSVFCCCFCFFKEVFCTFYDDFPMKWLFVWAWTLQFLIWCSKSFAFLLWSDLSGQGVHSHVIAHMYKRLCVRYCKAARRPGCVLSAESLKLTEGGNEILSLYCSLSWNKLLYVRVFISGIIVWLF